MSYENNISPRFETGVILRRPDNIKAVQRAERLQLELKKIVSDLYIRDSHPDSSGYKADIDEFGTGPETVWLPAGGDGTDSDLANALLEIDAPKSPIMFVPAGNANDIANGLAYFNPNEYPDALLKFGDIRKLRPLEVASTNPSSKELSIIYALGYFGLGYSGNVAVELDRPEYRNERDSKTPMGKVMTDGGLISSTLRTTPGVHIIENGVERLVFEMVYSNGPRMARGIRFKKLCLTKPVAARTELHKPNHFSFANVLFKAAVLGDLEYFDQSADFDFIIKSVAENEPVQGQRDGQPISFASGTKFNLKISDKYVNVLTSKLK